MRKREKFLWLSICLNIALITLFLLYKIGFISSIKQKFLKNTQIYSTYYTEKKSQFDNMNIPSNSIVFLGDSITDRCDWRELFNNNNIYNRGIESDTTIGILNRLDNITRYKPSKIFIMIGTNDINNNSNIDDIYVNYKKIIDKINTESPNTKIFIQSILPINSKLLKSARTNNDINKLNEKISVIDNTTYINLYSIFLNGNNLNEKYTIDGLHLNNDGYIAWKQAIEQYIDK